MKTLLCATLLALVAGAGALGPQDAHAQAQNACESYLNTPLPQEAAQVTPPTTWPDCNSLHLYSGVGVKADYAAARKCAWAERAANQAGLRPQDNYTKSSVLGGSAMLTNLYMNGEGVEKNPQLAMRFACEAGIGDDFEQMKAINEKMGPSRKKFKYCDYVSTTFQENFCAGYNADIAEQARTEALAKFSARWTPDQKAAFSKLEHAKEAYVEAHGNGETYLGGTIHNIRVNGVEERQRNMFLAAVREFEGGHLPRGSAADQARVDAQLNLLFTKTFAAAKEQPQTDIGAIKPEGIEKAEQAWLSYRDAWVDFAKLRYPMTDANAWLTLLTTNRVASLRMTLCGIDRADAECLRK